MVEMERDTRQEDIESRRTAAREQLKLQIELFQEIAERGDKSRKNLLVGLTLYESIKSTENFVNGVSKSIKTPDLDVQQWIDQVNDGIPNNYTIDRARRVFRAKTYETTDRKPGPLLRGLEKEEYMKAADWCADLSNIRWESAQMQSKNKK